MYQSQRRTCPRETYQAPIRISDKLDGDYFNAMMQNNSRNGMGLICDQPMDFGTGIYVNMIEAGKREIYRGFFGRVRWCRGIELPGNGNNHFDVGINFVIKSHNYFGGIGCMVDCCCDICGEQMPFDQLILTNESVLQCKECHIALKHYPEGQLKSSITNHVLGNIL